MSPAEQFLNSKDYTKEDEALGYVLTMDELINLLNEFAALKKKRKDKLDLFLLERKLNRALESETPESIKNWLSNKRGKSTLKISS